MSRRRSPRRDWYLTALPMLLLLTGCTHATTDQILYWSSSKEFQIEKQVVVKIRPQGVGYEFRALDDAMIDVNPSVVQRVMNLKEAADKAAASTCGAKAQVTDVTQANEWTIYGCFSC